MGDVEAQTPEGEHVLLLEQLNMAELRSQVHNVPRLSRCLIGVLVGLYVLCLLSPGARDMLVLQPGTSFQMDAIFRVVTSFYVDRNPLWIVLSVICVGWIGTRLEPKWGSREFARFVVVVNALNGVTMLLVMIMMYAITEDLGLLYGHVSGFLGMNAAFTVVCKQLWGTQILEVRHITLLIKHLPSYVALVSIVVWAATGNWVEPALALCGVMYGWTYLRYFQRHGDGQPIGDMRDEFSFPSFFPVPLRPAVKLLSELTYALLTKVGLFKQRREQARQGVAWHPIALHGKRTGSDAATSERRRARAMRTLEERLAAMGNKLPAGATSLGAAAAAAASVNSTHSSPATTPTAV